MIDGYYNRDNPSKEYEAHLFRAGFVLQSAELNEIQSAAYRRIAGIGDALFKDGDVVRDARIVVDSDTGSVTCESGAIYLSGSVRGVQPGTLTIPVVGTVVVGIYLQSSVITELEDPELRDPASLTRNYMEPGAARHKLHAAWGYAGDGQAGEFYAVYTVEDGQLQAKEAPPNLDSVTQALARYDRDSSGGSYVVSGLQVSQLDDLVTGQQVYAVAEGRARVNGYGIDLPTSRRIVYDATPDLRQITSEPKTSTTASPQRINVDRTPISAITQVQITAEKTVALTHGGFTGAQDPLPDTSVLSIVSVVQGGTTYVQNTDYKLTAGKVDWSLAGAEPATGSTYNVTYLYVTTATPTDIDETGFTIVGAVVGTLVLTTYSAKLPRIDRLCVDEEGSFVWIKGVATDYDPVRPQVPSNLLPLAQVLQTWTDRTVTNDGVRMVPMQDIEAISARLDLITDLVAQQKLISDLGTREAAAKKGLFVDPFLNDEQRDQGTTQDAAIVFGALTLPIEGSASAPSADLTAVTSCAFTLASVLEQTSRTGDMKINPYMAFDVPAVPIALTPAVDRWTEMQTSWLSPITQRFIAYAPGWHGANRFSTSSNTTINVASSVQSQIQNLRQIEVRFQASGFGPNEAVTSMTFDGIEVTPTSI